MKVTKTIYRRHCAYDNCGRAFSTDDPRKLYHTRKCGQNARQQRWFRKAQRVLRKQKQAA